MSEELPNFMKGDQRPKRYGWAPGNYIGRCRKCGTQYVGGKRTVICSDCAYKDFDQKEGE